MGYERKKATKIDRPIKRVEKENEIQFFFLF